MVASKKTIGKLGLYIRKDGEFTFDINPMWVVKPVAKVKLSKLEKKRRARKFAHKSRMYNYLKK